MQTLNKTLSETVSVCQLTWQEQRAVFLPHYAIFPQSNLISSWGRLFITKVKFNWSWRIDSNTFIVFAIYCILPYLVPLLHLTTAGFEQIKPLVFTKFFKQNDKLVARILWACNCLFKIGIFCFLKVCNFLCSVGLWMMACLSNVACRELFWRAIYALIQGLAATAELLSSIVAEC